MDFQAGLNRGVMMTSIEIKSYNLILITNQNFMLYTVNHRDGESNGSEKFCR